MTSAYNLLREACGLSQQEAADFHEARLDSVKSWCSDRRPAPKGVIDELKELIRDIELAGKELAGLLKRTSKDYIFTIWMPADAKDANVCGFPSLGAHLRAIGIAISALPDESEIHLVDRVDTKGVPTTILQRGVSKMRDINAPVQHDLPNPAPAGFQTIVNPGPRRGLTLAEKFNEQHIAAQDPRMFHADRGAKFEATLQKTPEGWQARFVIFVDVAGGTNSTSDIRGFDGEQAALAWLDQNAAAHGFAKYPLERRK